MKLPNGDQAVVPPPKLSAYLLSLTHPVGQSKARALRAAGFDEASVALLEQGPRMIAREEEIVQTEASLHGVKYVVDGAVMTPLGSSMRLRTVWIIDADQERPRFVTAYPVSRERG